MEVSPKGLNDAFNKTCKGVEKDMPTLLHAVGATSADPDAISLVAALTVQYMTKLVDAALECYEHQFPSQSLPPPPPTKRLSMKRKAPAAFDAPLPEPKIRRQEVKLPPPNKPAWCDADEPEKMPPPTMFEWTGVRGVDFWQDRRHPPPATTLSAHHFLFCLCHDTYLYGRIRQAIRNKKAEFVPLLTDPVVQEMVQEEAALVKEQEREKKSKKKNAPKKAADTSDGEDDEEEKEEEQRIEDDETPSWPVLDGLLPVVRHTPER